MRDSSSTGKLSGLFIGHAANLPILIGFDKCKYSLYYCNMQINFEILDIRAFLSVFETGSFNKAAQHLNISQPALSRRIKSLEEKIGSPLLERTTRRVTPTNVGRQMQPTLLRLIDELETSILSISETANKRAGQVTIACGPTAAFYFLPRVIREFQRALPADSRAHSRIAGP